jgi:type I restriction enzyme S subunit
MPAPSYWPRTRVKYVCRFAGGGTTDKGNIEYWNGEIPWVSSKDMKSSEVVDTEDHITKAGLDSSATKLVEIGAVLIVMRSGILRHSIPVAINRVPVTLNQDMRALIPASTLEPRYLARLIEGHQHQLLNVWSKEGTTVESLESDLVADTEIAIPPLIEQRAIADYLDRETARLDGLLAAKERVLGLVTEKRQALITRAVTRGLAPHAPLRDSGIPWLGEIPAHWGIWKVGHFAVVGNGSTPNRDNAAYWTEGLIPWLNSSVVNQEEVTEADQFITETAFRECHLPLVKSGSVLVGITGQGKTRGQAVVLSFEATINQHLSFITPKKGVADPWFLRWTLFAAYDFLRSISDDAGGTKGALTCEEVGALRMPLPPIDEQRAIVAHIATETAKLDALRTATEHTIALLKERCAALITAAVTGKITIHESTEESLPGADRC